MNLLKTLALKLLGLRRRWLGVWIGCFLWVLFMVAGFWATLLLFILATVGYFAGRVMEEQQSWKDVVTKLLAQRYGD